MLRPSCNGTSDENIYIEKNGKFSYIFHVLLAIPEGILCKSGSFLSFFSPFTVSPNIIDSETSSDVTVREGDNATLVCKATGHPPPRIIWKREDGEKISMRRGFREVYKGTFPRLFPHHKSRARDPPLFFAMMILARQNELSQYSTAVTLNVLSYVKSLARGEKNGRAFTEQMDTRYTLGCHRNN